MKSITIRRLKTLISHLPDDGIVRVKAHVDDVVHNTVHVVTTIRGGDLVIEVEPIFAYDDKDDY